MKVDIEHFLVAPSASLRDAMRSIARNASGIVFVADETKRLLGTLTDGDVRRGILAGLDLENEVRLAMNPEPKVVGPHAKPIEIETIFESPGVRVIPVVRQNGELIGLHELRNWGEARSQSSMPAVLMAGGLGTRLRPLTEDTPKPLLSVGGKPILERTIEHLKSSGVNEFVITTRYLAEQIEEFCGDGTQWNVGIDYLREEERLGTAGALRRLHGKVDRAFLVMNGDLLTDFDVEQMHEFHHESDAAMTVAVRHYSLKVPYGVAEVEGSLVKRLVEKPSYDFFVNAGIYILEPWTVEHIPAGEYYDITQLIDKMLEEGHRVASFPIVEMWMDIGRPEDLDRANAQLEEGNSGGSNRD